MLIFITIEIIQTKDMKSNNLRYLHVDSNFLTSKPTDNKIQRDIASNRPRAPLPTTNQILCRVTSCYGE